MRLRRRIGPSAWGKGSLSMTTGDQKVETPNGLTRMDLRIKESNRSLGRMEHPAISTVDSTLASVDMTQCDALDVVKRVIK